MKNNKFVVMIICLIIGFGLVVWGAVEYQNFPEMREIRKAAFREVWLKDAIGFALLVIAYVLTYRKKITMKAYKIYFKHYPFDVRSFKTESETVQAENLEEAFEKIHQKYSDKVEIFKSQARKHYGE